MRTRERLLEDVFLDDVPRVDDTYSSMNDSDVSSSWEGT